MAMAAANADNSYRLQNMVPIGGPIIKQPTFDWEAGDKYSDLKNSYKVNNMFFLSFSH